MNSTTSRAPYAEHNDNGAVRLRMPSYLTKRDG